MKGQTGFLVPVSYLKKISIKQTLRLTKATAEMKPGIEQTVKLE